MPKILLILKLFTRDIELVAPHPPSPLDIAVIGSGPILPSRSAFARVQVAWRRPARSGAGGGRHGRRAAACRVRERRRNGSRFPCQKAGFDCPLQELFTECETIKL